MRGRSGKATGKYEEVTGKALWEARGSEGEAKGKARKVQGGGGDGGGTGCSLEQADHAP